MYEFWYNYKKKKKKKIWEKTQLCYRIQKVS